jgi:hypothetical protein
MRKSQIKIKREYVKQKIAQQYYQVITKKIYVNLVSIKDILKDLFLGVGMKPSLGMSYNIIYGFKLS